MNFAAPTRDPGFAENSVHGALAQREFLNRVFLHCSRFRTAIDVGAHIGTCTDILARKFQNVCAFEPTDENFKCLQSNIGDRARLENVALGDFSTYGVMTLPREANSGMWYVREDEDAGVPVMPLDSYCLKQVDLIKIDTEGFEGRVLLGAQETIRASWPAVVFEDNGLGLKYYGTEWVDPKPLLASFGYKQAARIRKDEVWVPC